MYFFISVAVIIFILWFLHYLSYAILKNNIIASQQWDLNICCGKTDGGGINADIFKHTDVPNFVLVDSIYKLPFKEKQFDSVLCSHTIEHVEDPKAFFAELQRVGKEVTLILPPLYDLGAVLNVFEHRWIFLTFRKKHHQLPKHIPLPFSTIVHKWFGQKNNA